MNLEIVTSEVFNFMSEIAQMLRLSLIFNKEQAKWSDYQISEIPEEVNQTDELIIVESFIRSFERVLGVTLPVEVLKGLQEEVEKNPSLRENQFFLDDESKRQIKRNQFCDDINYETFRQLHHQYASFISISSQFEMKMSLPLPREFSIPQFDSILSNEYFHNIWLNQKFF
jgi:hypothetical protein